MKPKPVTIQIVKGTEQLTFTGFNIRATYVVATVSKANRHGFSAAIFQNNKARSLCGHIHKSVEAASRCAERIL